MSGEVTHQIGEPQSVTITWAPVVGATGYSEDLAPRSYGPWELPLPRGYRKLERALRRLEDAVTMWERALTPPMTYTYRITAVNASDEAVPSAQAVGDA